MNNFKCPECQNTSHKKWELPSLTVLHWVLNPGLAFNELVVGQAIPKQMCICTSCDKPQMERTYVYCPTCESFHNSMIWSGKKGIGRWFGFICPKCLQSIPRLWNLTSLIILGVTLPIWWIPAQILRKKWLAKERKQMNVGTDNLMPAKQPINWYEAGLMWGATTGTLVSLSDIFLSSISFTTAIEQALWSLPIWLIFGLLFGFSMKKTLGKTPEQQTQSIITEAKRKEISAPENQYNDHQEVNKSRERQRLKF